MPTREPAPVHEPAPTTEHAPASEPAPKTAPESGAKNSGTPLHRPLAEPRLGLFGRPIKRGGFHLQVGFGIGGGPDTSGLFHTMELGYTLPKSGYTIALLHTFIQSKDMLGDEVGGPDLIGGWMAEFKFPIFYPELVAKVALGMGGTHEQPDDGPLVAHPGFGASYGFDLHFPVWQRFGPTLTLAAMNVTAEGQHHFGVGTALGVTLF